jgi:hypothetical protein
MRARLVWNNALIALMSSAAPKNNNFFKKATKAMGGSDFWKTDVAPAVSGRLYVG